MTLPACLFGFLVSIMFGAGFHLWKNGGLSQLVLYELLSGFGFWSGHTFSSMIGWDFWKLGPLHLGFAIGGTILFLGVGYWLSIGRKSLNVKK
jgi:hypothetical protein